jgi:hypothetical protein
MEDLKGSTKGPKWFQRGSLTFAWAGDVRTAQVVEYESQFRGPRKGEDPLRYLVGTVAKGIRSTLLKAGSNLREQGSIDSTGTEFLVVYNGKLYQLSVDYSVLECPSKLASIGSGAPYALGAMSALSPLPSGVTPEKALRKALKTSATFCQHVSEPFYVERFG